jgi:hypothetical protein
MPIFSLKSPLAPLALFAAAMFGISPLAAQQAPMMPAPAPRAHVASSGGFSPHETFSKVFDRNRITIVYGRPYSKDPKTGELRKIWGGLIGDPAGQNPWGKAWRAGSDEATLFITQKPIMLGGTAVPAGAYTLFLIPSQDGTAKLVVNKQLGQWGLQYDAKQDFARIDLTRSDLDQSIDQFTMALDKDKDHPGGGVLKISWETTQYSVPLTVMKP